MDSLDQLADMAASALARTGPYAPAVLLAASFVEYVFPPFPGDTIVLLGAWYAVQGAISWPLAFVAVTLGAVGGAWVDWRIGRVIGARTEAGLGGSGWLDRDRLLRFEAAYRRWGSLLLLGNRFLPGIRAFLFVAAGASGIPLKRVLLLGAISAGLWNALLLALGGLVVRNLTELVSMMERYTHAVWVLLALAALGLVARALWRRHRAG